MEGIIDAVARVIHASESITIQRPRGREAAPVPRLIRKSFRQTDPAVELVAADTLETPRYVHSSGKTRGVVLHAFAIRMQSPICNASVNQLYARVTARPLVRVFQHTRGCWLTVRGQKGERGRERKGVGGSTRAK